ncbi:MAG: 16S rRNA (cytidine(1402)-2'-O)-methyltransferase [Armatimonadetes bacterium]|nr:16S rRNA (cytidine(1402)-2'-O)-methyltransferase [Armatimonadota bacterium]
MPLYVVATPIGNLEDMTLRALRTLQEADLIAAEDTRHSRKLLARYEIKTPLISFHEHSTESRIESLIERLRNGETIALITDGGTPGVSDPGAKLVLAALSEGLTVSPLPGPSAVSAALSVSGFAAQFYRFLGFLPRKDGQQRAIFEQYKDEPGPVVFFESPYRIGKTLANALSALGDRPVAVCREMTKQHEEIYRGMLAQAVEKFSAPDQKGEFTVVIGR